MKLSQFMFKTQTKRKNLTNKTKIAKKVNLNKKHSNQISKKNKKIQNIKWIEKNLLKEIKKKETQEK